MERRRKPQWAGVALLLAALTLLAACAPGGVPGQQTAPPQTQLATATANAATYAASAANAANATSASELPQLKPDPGWVAVVQVPDGLKLGGPAVMGDVTGSSTASVTLTLGSFKLSSGATVVMLFDCISPSKVSASLTISLSTGDSTQIPCNARPGPGRTQSQFLASWAGQRITVSATIATNGSPPEWNLLVEQPQ